MCFMLLHHCAALNTKYFGLLQLRMACTEFARAAVAAHILSEDRNLVMIFPDRLLHSGVEVRKRNKAVHAVRVPSPLHLV